MIPVLLQAARRSARPEGEPAGAAGCFFAMSAIFCASKLLPGEARGFVAVVAAGVGLEGGAAPWVDSDCAMSNTPSYLRGNHVLLP